MNTEGYNTSSGIIETVWTTSQTESLGNFRMNLLSARENYNSSVGVNEIFPKISSNEYIH